MEPKYHVGQAVLVTSERREYLPPAACGRAGVVDIVKWNDALQEWWYHVRFTRPIYCWVKERDLVKAYAG